MQPPVQQWVVAIDNVAAARCDKLPAGMLNMEPVVKTTKQFAVQHRTTHRHLLLQCSQQSLSQ